MTTSVEFTSSLLRWATRGGAAAAVLLLFLGAAWITRWLLRRFARSLSGRERLRALTLLGSAASVALVVLGMVTALGTLGINVSAMVASLGLTGFALGFALRDALANLLAGLLILFYRPFVPGQRIAVAGFEGVVDDINLRYISLRTKDRTVLIPSSTVLTDPVAVLDSDTPQS